MERIKTCLDDALMLRNVLALFFLITVSFSLRAQTVWPEALLLTPEKSDFEKTSSYADVMRFINAVKEKSQYAHIISMGKSYEGREIPVVVLAKPIIRTPEEARASGKVLVYIQGNIHAGEVEGKEAAMMLMRDILLGDKSSLLDNQIILFAPVYNADGNDKMEKGRRPSQEDSPLEVGTRENGQGFDLNRDGVKMEAHETQGLFTNIILPWDPHVFVDLHTTNGTWHAYSLTWAPGHHSAGDYSVYDFTNNEMLNSITKTMKEKYSLHVGPYGDYDLSQGWPPKNFYTYNHHPRYLVNQFGIRNRIGILSEAFAHERFYQRIYSTYSFVIEILSYTNDHAGRIKDLLGTADSVTVQHVLNNAGKMKKGVRFTMEPLEILNDFLTYDYLAVEGADGENQLVRTGNIVRYDSVVFHAKFNATVESTLPRGYIIPKELSPIAEHLEKCGVRVERLTKSRWFEGETFQITTLNRSSRKFEGHFMASVKGTFQTAKKRFQKGDFVVDLAQPLANYIFYLLEPQSDDGLVTWNFLDSYLEKQGIQHQSVEYPVFKYYK